MKRDADRLEDECAQALWGAGSEGAHPDDLHVQAGAREAVAAIERLAARGFVVPVGDRVRLTEAGRSWVARGLRAVTRIPTGGRARVVHIEFDDGERLVRLSSLGIVPGAILELLQRLPTFVVRTGETTVALDREIAGGILVHPID